MLIYKGHLTAMRAGVVGRWRGALGGRAVHACVTGRGSCQESARAN